MNRIMFSNGVELGKFLGSIDVIPDAYRAISEMNSLYELSTTRSGIQILALRCSSEYTTRFLNGGIDLISSEGLPVIDFISTKVNPSFSVNEAAVELFQHLSDDLKGLENKLKNTSLIITGSGLGGYLAILSTLRLHHAIDVDESIGVRYTKRPICVTFGSPIIGDKRFQGAIAERPRWKSSFLNVVAKKDPVASFFSSNTPYMPLGTYLFCTESDGYTTFEDQDSILLVLDAMRLRNSCNLQIYDYTSVFSSIRKKVLYRGIFGSDELFTFNSLRAGITLQLKEAGVVNDITDDQIGKMEKKQMQMIKWNNIANAYEPSKRLNDMKISLTYMEWYMKTTKTMGGYYDAYKNPTNEIEKSSCQEIRKNRLSLNAYWKQIVEEKDQMPQKEGAKLRRRWLFGGTNYRRIVEPLDIADYYRTGKHNYMMYKSNHYKLLEKWSDEDKKNSGGFERNKAASLTEDSCFWAHVEEALISLKDLKDGLKAPVNIKKKLVEFEAYVMREINNYSVSPDIFLVGSSFMKWWNEYRAHKGAAYASELAQFMNNKAYRSYQ